MSAEIFVDTNIVLYAQSGHPEEAGKRSVARRVIAENSICLSVQVLSEFYVNATRKLQPALEHSQAVEVIQNLMKFPVAALDADTVLKALDLKRLYPLSYWDAMILSAAMCMGCREIFSEDLSDGQSYGSIRVVNPFR